MSSLRRYLFTMTGFSIIIAIGAGFLYSELEHAFIASPVLNGVILSVLVIGIIHAFRTVATLSPEVEWIEDFKRNHEGGSITLRKPPRLMAPAATMLAERSEHSRYITLSPSAMQTLLDGVSLRLDEARETSKYLIGLLVFLGLLGTFWGLMETINSVGNVIANLNISGDDISSSFEDLKIGLQQPLKGMGTAFSSSLFGLAGSLFLGFLALQESHAQNRFYNDLEEWLSGLTRLSSGGISGDSNQSMPAYIQALLEQTADSLESLQRTMQRGEDDRLNSQDNMVKLNERLGQLADSMKIGQNLMLKMAESQQSLNNILVDFNSNNSLENNELGVVSQGYLRNIDKHLNRMLDEQIRGRDDAVQDIRNEIRLLARTIAASVADSN